MPETWHRHSWKRWIFLLASHGSLWQSEELFLGIQTSSLLHGSEESPRCCGDAGTTVHRWTGWWEALQHHLCQAKQVTLEAWFAGTFYYLGKGLGDILTRGGRTDEHWSSGSWQILLAQYGSATAMTWLQWSGNTAMQCCLFSVMQLVWFGLSLHCGGSVSEPCCAVLAAAAAAASRHFASLAYILPRAAQRSLRLGGLDTVFFLLFRMVETVILEGVSLSYVTVLA